ncbi:membrane-spanning 4-domains subfamily A member 12-like isoform X2 [Oncorhynchus masou masou]|uniref:membrane-spanning 4-domains subfamily A member 12-like isoform X2 n=1 Tax=Oncorhynchus masou masou TaxID=90313 RepID=UPI003183C254
MSSSQTTTTNGAVVITHVYPYGSGMGVAGVASTPHCLGQTVSSVLESFRAGHPKALGYVVAGSLTVAADNKLNNCLVNGSLGMNVVASVTALTGIILHSLDSAGIMLYYCNSTYHLCQQYWIRSQGISGVLAVFSLLEFIVSICVSSFACRAVCLCCRSTPEQVSSIGYQIPVPHGRMTQSNAPYPPQNNYETGNYPNGTVGDGMGTGFQQNPLPPQYTADIP